MTLTSAQCAVTDPDIVVLTEMHYDPQASLKRKEDGMAPYQRFKARYPVSIRLPLHVVS